MSQEAHSNLGKAKRYHQKLQTSGKAAKLDAALNDCQKYEHSLQEARSDLKTIDAYVLGDGGCMLVWCLVA